MGAKLVFAKLDRFNLKPGLLRSPLATGDPGFCSDIRQLIDR
jgi:hypothetical protein